MSANRPTSKFSFLDEGEAIRRLGIDRDRLLTLVREKRLRAYPGVGKGSFFRVSDLDKLAAELGLAAPTPPPTVAPLLSADAITVRKGHDPAYKVHLRLQGDLKWFDVTEADLAAWVRELHPDGYRRQRSNIDAIVAKLGHLRDLMDEAASHWQNLPSEDAPGKSDGESG
jgi:hypothetical protein